MYINSIVLPVIAALHAHVFSSEARMVPQADDHWQRFLNHVAFGRASWECWVQSMLYLVL
jgi:hypothetical protein